LPKYFDCRYLSRCLAAGAQHLPRLMKRGGAPAAQCAIVTRVADMNMRAARY